jgi:N-acetylglucosamine-6-phosphate deacetylase
MLKIFFTLFLLSTLQLFSLDAAPVSIFPSSKSAAEKAARQIANLILEKKEERVVLGLATGKTMIPVYEALKRMIREQSIDLSNVTTFNLDEYLDISPSDPQSFRSFMFANLFEEILFSPQNPLGIKEENIHIPSKEAWENYETLIQELGPIDLQLLGIGRNGHIGFSEPGTPFDSRTMIVNLTETTRQDNADSWNGQLDLVPKRAITMGIATILEAKEILLVAYGENKADAIAKTLSGPLTVQVPSTSLQKHPRTSFILDEKAAELLKDSRVQRFINGLILINGQLKSGELWVANGKVIPPQQSADIEIDASGKIIAPGYIDIQINGGFGCDFSRNPEKIDRVAKELLQYGVTAFLPTIISSTPQQYRAVLPLLQPCTYGKGGAAVLGIHLEGPFFSPKYPGAHNPQFLYPSFKQPIEEVYGNLQGVKIVTLAPEIPGADNLIKTLRERGIYVAVGHSAASLEQMNSAIKAGACLATHLFNQMSPYHHRNPSIVGAALINPSLPYSLILDGVHLSPESVRLCWYCNPNGLILISDATEALGLPEGNYKLGTLDIEVQGDQVCLRGTQTIAGSNLNLSKAVRRLHSITQCSKAEALSAASLKPAQLIHAYPKKGTLEIGADADFIILSEELEVEATYVGGELAWKPHL